ncbi:addiction module toxin RelE [Rhizobium croatiense]|uniref:addiction module toxin RelE n=1 Tax=Rhizobium croatiense TaxID=2867516 RepID=UPI0023EE163F|nr:addiction module toxin RelE [Rhizobium croatiense]WET72899.1 addiction module toxin RelE [Rhizobium croatiense]
MFKVVRLERGGSAYPITIAELKSAQRDLQRILSEDEADRLFDFLAVNPESGDVIPETGGIRKLRWKGQGKGQSKGIRVCYFYHDLNMPLFILAVYGKGEQLRLSKREEQSMAKLVRELTEKYRMKWEETLQKGKLA